MVGRHPHFGNHCLRPYPASCWKWFHFLPILYMCSLGSESSSCGDDAPYLYDASILHHIPMHLLILRLILFLFHLSCMLFGNIHHSKVNPKWMEKEQRMGGRRGSGNIHPSLPPNDKPWAEKQPGFNSSPPRCNSRAESIEQFLKICHCEQRIMRSSSPLFTKNSIGSMFESVFKQPPSLPLLLPLSTQS